MSQEFNYREISDSHEILDKALKSRKRSAGSRSKILKLKTELTEAACQLGDLHHTQSDETHRFEEDIAARRREMNSRHTDSKNKALTEIKEITDQCLTLENSPSGDSDSRSSSAAA